MSLNLIYVLFLFQIEAKVGRQPFHNNPGQYGCVHEGCRSCFPGGWTKSVSFAVLQSFSRCLILILCTSNSMHVAFTTKSNNCTWPSFFSEILSIRSANLYSLTKSRGLEIWRIENFRPVPVPKASYGKFFTGDSYVVLKVLEVPFKFVHDEGYFPSLFCLAS